MNQLTEIFIRLKQTENAMDIIALSLPETDEPLLQTIQVRAKKRQERYQAEYHATQEYHILKSRVQELENDYPALKNL